MNDEGKHGLRTTEEVAWLHLTGERTIRGWAKNSLTPLSGPLGLHSPMLPSSAQEGVGQHDPCAEQGRSCSHDQGGRLQGAQVSPARHPRLSRRGSRFFTPQFRWRIRMSARCNSTGSRLSSSAATAWSHFALPSASPGTVMDSASQTMPPNKALIANPVAAPPRSQRGSRRTMFAMSGRCFARMAAMAYDRSRRRNLLSRRASRSSTLCMCPCTPWTPRSRMLVMSPVTCASFRSLSARHPATARPRGSAP